MAQDLAKCVFRILNIDGKTAGTGFLLGDTLGVTCAHVIADALKNTDCGPGCEIEVVFTWHDGQTYHQEKTTALVLKKGWSPTKQDDTAFLRLENVPSWAEVVRLASAKEREGHDAICLGYPEPQSGRPERSVDKIAGMLALSYPRLQFQSNVVRRGYSGAPVLDTKNDQVVGMVTWGIGKDHGIVVHAVPADTLKMLWPELVLEYGAQEQGKKKAPFLVEPLPDNFVLRQEEFEAIVQALVKPSRGRTIGITAALRGAGGYGKTTLARAVCWDQRVIDAFPDGVLWTTLGENPSEQALVGKIGDLVEALSGDRFWYIELLPAATRLRELLKKRTVLLVIDDVWQRSSLAPFLQPESKSVCLITTRRDDTLPDETERIKVYAMRPDEAVDLLRSGLPSGEDAEMRELAARLGEWPLLLKLVNGVLRVRVKLGETIQEALAYANQEWTRRGIMAFDMRDAQQRDEAVRITISISLLILSEDDRRRFLELAVFPVNVDIPLTVVEMLWHYTGGLDRGEVENLCLYLANNSLLLHFDLKKRLIRLHDVIRKYLVDQQKDQEKELQRNLVDIYRGRCPAGWPSGFPDGYFFRWLAYHLSKAGLQDELEELLLDFNWLNRHLRNGGIGELIGDYEVLEGTVSERNYALQMAQGALRLSAQILANDPDQLAGQLVGRLSLFDDEQISKLVKQSRSWKNKAWLQPIRTGLALPGGNLLATLRGHNNIVNAIAISPDGRLAVSASWDHTLKVWEIASGHERFTLTGHYDWVTSVAISPDGNLAISASLDASLKVWDMDSGRERFSLIANHGPINAVAISPDGKLAVSASSEGTLEVWDLDNGEERFTLVGHIGPINAVTISPDSQLVVSACSDRTLKVWDLAKGHERFTLTGHTAGVKSVVISPDGRLAVSASWDRTLKVWNLSDGLERFTLRGHIYSITALAISRDGRLAVSASMDATLKVWDLVDGQERFTLRGHDDSVLGVTISPNGRFVISASWDYTLKAWDLVSGQERLTLTGHTDGVNIVAINPDGRLAVSASVDGVLKVWNLTGRFDEYFTRRSHTDVVNAVAISPIEPLAVSASRDWTLKAWNLESGEERFTLVGHNGPVNEVAISQDGWIAVSASSDGTLKVWDLIKGQERFTLVGHNGPVNAVAISQDGRLALSASSDQALKVWDLVDGQERFTLTGHNGPITAMAISQDGRLALSASSDEALKVWDLVNKRERFTLGVRNYGVNAVAISPDGQLGVSASLDGTLKVWNLVNGMERTPLRGHRDGVNALVMRLGGRLTISASMDATLKAWNLANRNEHFTLRGHEGPITSVAVSQNGRLAVSVSIDRMLKIWDLKNEKCISTFKGEEELRCSAISQEGMGVIAGGEHGGIYIFKFNLKSRKE